MLKLNLTFTAASFLALAATALCGGASAGPCIPGTGSSGPLNTLVCIGGGTLASNTDGIDNTAMGLGALNANKTGSYNTAYGYTSLRDNDSGARNTATGYFALLLNSSGSNNTAAGSNAGGKQTGSNNTSLGAEAGWRGEYSDTIRLTGSNNIALGYQAGSQWTTGSNNIVIGHVGGSNDANIIRIGTSQTATYVAGIYNTKVTKARTVLVNSLGQLGTSRSSIRYKEDVHSMGDASSPLMNLRPVTFRYKQAESDGSKPIQYGLIAEEVEKVMPDLVIYNDQGTPESVAYETIPSLLLNEYQKQGRELAAAKAELGETKARLEAMDAELAALKLAVSHLAAAPSNVRLATTAP
jgi:hypothetical protein